MTYPPPPTPNGPEEEPTSPYGSPGGPYTPEPYQPGPYQPPSQDPQPGPYGQPGQPLPGEFQPGQFQPGPYQAGPYGTPPPQDTSASVTPSPYGTPPPVYGAVAPYPTTSSQQSNGLGIAALVLGIIGLMCGGFFGVAGLVLAIMARKAVADGRASNGGVATGALVVSIVAVAIWAFVWVGAVASS